MHTRNNGAMVGAIITASKINFHSMLWILPPLFSAYKMFNYEFSNQN